MRIEKALFKIIFEITHATGKYLQGLMGPAISKGSFKYTKSIYLLTCLATESLKMFILFPLPEQYVCHVSNSGKKLLAFF